MTDNLTRPIVGIENRTAQEVFDIMVDRIRRASQPPSPQVESSEPQEIPGEMEMFEGRLMKVVNAGRSGWWRFHEHYDRNGYCDNPGRGY